MNNLDKQNILEDLLNNKLNIKNNIEEIKKSMYPFDNFKDYVKYGDMFLKLNLNKDEQPR